MNSLLLAFLAALPLLGILALLVGLQWPARRAMPAAFGITLAVALLGWRMPAAWIGASIVRGLVVALEVVYIIFGALLLLRTLERSGGMARIKAGFSSNSSYGMDTTRIPSPCKNNSRFSSRRYRVRSACSTWGP